MKYKIGVVTGTRAEYGILKPLIEKIYKCKDLELCLIVTGTHLEEEFGNTYKEIENDNYPISYRIPMNLKSDSKKNNVESLSKELNLFGTVLNSANPDMMVVLGDRYEILVAATAALIFNIPIAHIHGGEITEGAVDDAIRHAITKLSYLHFASTEAYAKRIIQMGETPERVFNVGALGVENIKKCKLLEHDELVTKYGSIFEQNYIMVTFHPVTLEEETSKKQFAQLLNVIDRHKEYNYIFTYANADADGKIINEMIDEYVLKNTNCVTYKSMGQTGYLSAIKYCTFVIGNSSSGIIEVPSFEKPSVNIGSRQKGRIKAESVIDCNCTEKDIELAFNTAVSYKERFHNIVNPYEGEDTSDKILEIILNTLKGKIDMKKHFYDME